jgi:outer membrane lipoprotein-sorting protein
MHFRIAFAFVCAVSAFAAPAEASLQATMARVDRAAADFKGMSASVRRVYHTAVINDDTVDSGTMNLKRVKAREYRMRVDLTDPDPRSLAFDGRKAELYFPKIMTVQEFDLGKHRGMVDQFLLLGFGSTAKELEAAYSIRLVGARTIAGQAATQLELIPKSKDILQHLNKVELWVSDATGYPVQQRFLLPGGDYQMVTYTGVKINPNLPDSAVKLQLPRGVKRETPQKH